MSIRLLTLISVIIQLHSSCAQPWEHFAKPMQLLANRQCTYKHPLATVEFSSSRDGLREIAFAEHQSIFHDHYVAYESADADLFWSYPPICTGIIRDMNDRLCIYTAKVIGGEYGRGITVFTTPALAESIASLPIFTQCPGDDHICQQTRASLQINKNSGAWRTSNIPGKGIGMLASKDLQFGDLVTAYTPAFIAYLESGLSTLDREVWWRQAIEQLPKKTRKDFLGLTYIFGDKRIRVQDIVKANTFQLDIDGVNHLAVFPETSRMNHACNPNAQYVIDNDLLTHTVRVTRDIQQGEEITIAYTSPLEPTAVRQQNLQQGFHFTCTCPRCTNSTSDTLLQTIISLQAHLNDWSSTSLASPEMAEQLLRIHRDQGLEGFMDVAYGFAALAWNAVGDVGKAVFYAEKAQEAILMKDGRWAPNLRIWREMLGDPEGHWSFGRRG